MTKKNKSTIFCFLSFLGACFFALAPLNHAGELSGSEVCKSGHLKLDIRISNHGLGQRSQEVSLNILGLKATSRPETKTVGIVANLRLGRVEPLGMYRCESWMKSEGRFIKATIEKLKKSAAKDKCLEREGSLSFDSRFFGKSEKSSVKICMPLSGETPQSRSFRQLYESVELLNSVPN